MMINEVLACNHGQAGKHEVINHLATNGLDKIFSDAPVGFMSIRVHVFNELTNLWIGWCRTADKRRQFF